MVAFLRGQEGHHVLTALRTARQWQQPPTGWLGLAGTSWTGVDRVLTIALTLHEDGLCSGCWQPRDLAHGEDAQGWYAAAVVTCDACAAMDDKRSAEPGQAVETGPGAKMYPVDLRPTT